MTQHRVVLDVAARALEIRSPTFGDLTLYLPSQESTRSCAFTMIELPLKKIPVVCEYADVFPDELPGMPPDRDIEFAIELQPGTAPISKRPYRMPPAELAELITSCKNCWTKVSSAQVLHLGDVHLVHEEEG